MKQAGRWLFNSRRTRAQRKRQRLNITLKDAGITEKTQNRYYAGLRLLLPYLQYVHSMLQLDEAVSQWLQDSWERGDALYSVSDGLCGLHHYEPWTRGHIPQSWKLFAVWRKLEAPSRAPPLTRYIVYSWSNYAVEHSDLEFGALILLGFFALLRTGELLNVRAADLLFGPKDAIVSLQDTKSGKRNNVAEMVSFNDPWTLDFLRAVVAIKRKQGMENVPIWNRSPQAFRNLFRQYCWRFDLERRNFRPYSLRRGGATWVFQVSGSMETALVKGRWGSARVARIYISDALSYLPNLTFSKAARATLQNFSPLSTFGRGGGSWKNDKNQQKS